MASNPRDPEVLNIALLERLREAEGQYVSLAGLGADRKRVWDDLDALAQFGFQIDRHPYLGVAFRGPASRLCPDMIEHELRTRTIGRRIAVWNRVGSTNDLAARAASNIANDGLVILAEEQTAGRGQRGRLWTAPAQSSILMSILIFPPANLRIESGRPRRLCLAHRAGGGLDSRTRGRLERSRRPHQVAQRRSRGGPQNRRHPGRAPHSHPTTSRVPTPRIQRRDPGVVIGIGLNVNVPEESFPSDLRPRATSLAILGRGEPIDRSRLARDLIRRLDGWYEHIKSEGPGVLNGPWRARSEHLGNMVRITTRDEELHGRLVGLELDRGLTVELNGSEPAAYGPATADSPEPGPKLRQVALSHVLTLEE